MTLKQYLLIMTLATVLCWVSWFFVLFNVDPFRDTGIGFIFFYITLFLSVLGTVALITFLLSLLFLRQKLPMYKYVHKTFVLGFTTSCIVLALLYLQSKAVLNTWNIIIFFGILIFLSLFKLSLHFSENVTQE